MRKNRATSGGRAILFISICFTLAFTRTPTNLISADDARQIIDLGSQRELFVDRHIVGEMRGTALKLHTPQLMSPISPPRPHGHYATVLRSDDGFQFYYRGDTQPGNHWKKGWEQYHEGEVTLYAESSNGIDWTLPKIGIYDDHPTFPAGNIVLMNEFLVNHNFTPFIDTRPGVSAAERYKALGGLAYQPHKEHLEVRDRRGPEGVYITGRNSLEEVEGRARRAGRMGQVL
jgi:hypothetical protein